MKRNEKGITLIALVITIIVLLILATVSLVSVRSNRGIISKTNTAKIETSHAKVKESLIIAFNDYQLELEQRIANTINNLDNVVENKQGSESRVRDSDLATEMESSSTGSKSQEKLASGYKVNHAGDDSAGITINKYTFKQYCIENKYCDTAGKINVNNLVGQSTDFGKGTGAFDVYKLSETGGMGNTTGGGSTIKGSDIAEEMSGRVSGLHQVESNWTAPRFTWKLDYYNKNGEKSQLYTQDYEMPVLDMATEMIPSSNNNILQRPGQSQLSNANQSDRGVLSLIE